MDFERRKIIENKKETTARAEHDDGERRINFKGEMQENNRRIITDLRNLRLIADLRAGTALKDLSFRKRPMLF